MRGGTANWRTISAALGLLVVGSIAELVAILHATGGHFIYTLDDAYIHLALAENLAGGHYGINTIEPAAPSSSILWPFLLAPSALYSFGELVPLTLNLLAASATVFIVHAVLRQCFGEETARRRFLVAVVTAAMVPACNLIGLAFTGMEHSLQVLLALASIAGLLERERRDRTPGWITAVLVLGPLVRYENLAISLPVLAVLFHRGERRRAMVTAAVLAAVLVGFSFFLNAEGLGFLPSSVLAKSSIASTGGPGAVLNSLRENLLDVRGLALLGVGAAAAAYTFGRGQMWDRPLALLGLASIAMHLVAGRFGWFGRYEVYVWASALLLAAHLFRAPARAFADRAGWPVLAFGAFTGFAAACLPYLHTHVRTAAASKNIYSQQYQMHRFATEYYRAPVGVNDLGWVAYRNPNYTLDLFGLGSHEVLLHRSRKDGPAWMDELARRYRVELVMIYPDWFEPLPPGWQAIGVLHMEGPLTTCASTDVTFFALTEAAATRARPLLADFARTLPPGDRFEFASR